MVWHCVELGAQIFTLVQISLAYCDEPQSDPLTVTAITLAPLVPSCWAEPLQLLLKPDPLTTCTW